MVNGFFWFYHLEKLKKIMYHRASLIMSKNSKRHCSLPTQKETPMTIGKKIGWKLYPSWLPAYMLQIVAICPVSQIQRCTYKSSSQTPYTPIVVSHTVAFPTPPRAVGFVRMNPWLLFIARMQGGTVDTVFTQFFFPAIDNANKGPCWREVRNRN